MDREKVNTCKLFLQLQHQGTSSPQQRKAEYSPEPTESEGTLLFPVHLVQRCQKYICLRSYALNCCHLCFSKKVINQ